MVITHCLLCATVCLPFVPWTTKQPGTTLYLHRFMPLRVDLSELPHWTTEVAMSLTWGIKRLCVSQATISEQFWCCFYMNWDIVLRLCEQWPFKKRSIYGSLQKADIIKGFWLLLLWSLLFCYSLFSCQVLELASDDAILGYFKSVSILVSLPHRSFIASTGGRGSCAETRLIWQMGSVWGVIIARPVSAPLYGCCAGISLNPRSLWLSKHPAISMHAATQLKTLECLRG